MWASTLNKELKLSNNRHQLKVDYLQENSYLSWFFIIICSLYQDEGHTEWVSCVRFSPNSTNPIIVSAGWDKVVKVFLKYAFFKTQILYLEFCRLFTLKSKYYLSTIFFHTFFSYLPITFPWNCAIIVHVWSTSSVVIPGIVRGISNICKFLNMSSSQP